MSGLLDDRVQIREATGLLAGNGELLRKLLVLVLRLAGFALRLPLLALRCGSVCYTRALSSASDHLTA